jgi:hypothetical protein
MDAKLAEMRDGRVLMTPEERAAAETVARAFFEARLAPRVPLRCLPPVRQRLST